MQWTVTQTSAAGQWTGTVVGDKPAFIAGGGAVGSYGYGSKPCCPAKHQKHSNNIYIYIIDVSEPWVYSKVPFSQGK